MLTLDFEAARRQATALFKVAEHLRVGYWLASPFWSQLQLSRLEGNWQAARDLSDRGLLVANVDHRLLAPLAQIEYEIGDFAAGEPFLGRLLLLSEVPLFWRC